MKRVLQFTLVLLLFSCLINTAAPQYTPAAVKNALNSIVAVEIDDNDGNTTAIGLGFFISKNKIITHFSKLYNHIPPENQVEIYVKSVGKKTRYFVKDMNIVGEKQELAFLNVSIPGVKPLSISNELQHNGTTYTINTTSKSSVEKGKIKGNSKNNDYIRITNPISDKNIGGPILNSKGKVIGLAILLSELRNGINYDDGQVTIKFGGPGNSVIVKGENSYVNIKNNNTTIGVKNSAFAVSSHVLKELLVNSNKDSTNIQLVEDINDERKTDSNRIDKTFDVVSGGRLKIETDSGEIDVKTHDKDTVEVRVIKEIKKNFFNLKNILNDFNVTYDHNSPNLSITGKFQRGRDFWQRELNDIRIHFQVTVPQDFDVDLNTRIDDISVNGVTGELQVSTSTGDITVKAVTGPTQVHTSTGDLHLEKIIGDISGGSSTGDITMLNCQGSISVKSSTGDIRMHLPSQLQHAWNIQTSTGDISLTLTSDLAANLDIKTSVGDISTDFPVLTTDMQKKRLRGTINGGGQLLKLQTSTGDIRLKSR
ncbi:hypothetical protein C6497_07075 [Candidatus Poribacteria bacterium]|nr:MAG: hypothetical protein C6497_07075 [Candidatus Poribacteria bacterium]